MVKEPGEPKNYEEIDDFLKDLEGISEWDDEKLSMVIENFEKSKEQKEKELIG
jgi:hypothetical protein